MIPRSLCPIEAKEQQVEGLKSFHHPKEQNEQRTSMATVGECVDQ
jgi:hypothetical protein